MALQPLTLKDKSAITAVLNSRARTDLVGVTWTIDTILEELKTSQSLKITSSDQARRVEDLGDEPISAFILFKDLGGVLEILLIYSHSKARGAAERALKALIAAYPAAQEIWLEVHEDNTPAIRFYERQGFKRVSRRRNYYPDGKAAFNYNLVLKP